MDLDKTLQEKNKYLELLRTKLKEMEEYKQRLIGEILETQGAIKVLGELKKIETPVAALSIPPATPAENLNTTVKRGKKGHSAQIIN